MTIAGDSLQSAAQLVAETLLPFLASLDSDDEIIAFVADLGWTLPAVPPSIPALGASGDAMLDALAEVQAAADALDDETGDQETLNQALATLALRVTDFASQAASMRGNLAAELPPDFVAATGIADNFSTRLFESLALRTSNTEAGLTTAIATLLGLAEQDDIAEDAARFQPSFTRRGLRLDRVGPLVSSPKSVLQDVYGWGTPTLNLDRLYRNIERLSYQLLGPIEVRYPSDAFLAAVAPGAAASDNGGPPPAFTIPIYEGGPITVVIAVMPLPKATPTELQGVAVTLQLQLADSAGFALGPGLTLAVDGTLDLSSGVAAVLRPDRDPQIVLNSNGSSNGPATGRGGARVTFGDADNPTRLLTIPGGSFLEAARLYYATGVDARTSPADFYIEAGLTGGALTIKSDSTDGFLAEILPSDGISAHFDLGVTWSQRGGLRFSGSADLHTALPINITTGPFTIQSIAAALIADANGISLELGADGAAKIGPITATVAGLGVLGRAAFRDGNLGPVDLAIGYKGPSGIGVSVDVAGVVSGSGFLGVEPLQHAYSGTMQLSLHETLTVTAIGLIATQLPDGSPGYSLLVFITAEDFQPIPLGLGFTLQGIGGMVGVNRTFDQNVLYEGLKNDTLSTLLFPRDPVANAPAIVRALGSAFPAQRGSYLLGLLARICWGTPTLFQLDLALIMELGARTRLLVLARVSALLPTADNDLVRLKLDAMGVVDFDAGTIALDAVLVDSRLVHKFAITGSGAFRAGWGAPGPGKGFVLSVGGFNPRFAPPAGMPALDRVTVALSAGGNPRLTCESYFALTANTIQFGARAQLYASAIGFSLNGDIGFDVLVSRPFHFIADFEASVQLKRGSHNLFKVAVSGTLEGPMPLRLSGKATFEILWCDFTVHFNATLVDGDPPTLAAVNVQDKLVAALVAPQAWRTLPPPVPHGVTLRRTPPGTMLVVDPLGQLEVTQDVVPLGTGRDLDTFGGAPVAGARRFSLGVTFTNATPTQPVQASFAPAQFFAMSDDEKLASPSFEDMQSGLIVGSEGVSFDQTDVALVAAPLTYASIVLDGPTLSPVAPPSPQYALPASRLTVQSASGAAARAPVRRAGRARYRTDTAPAVSLPSPRWAIVPKSEGPAAVLDPSVTTWSEHRAVLNTLNRGGALWQIVPAHELP